MSSARQIKSETSQARSIPGPKTVGGKARSARNALRHGLSLPILSYPIFSEEVEALARDIAGKDANLELQELARRIAEAQIDLKRVRSARHEILSSAIDAPSYESPPEGPQKLATVFSDMTRRLAAMDRYERRALSRRKFAIRAFDVERRRAVEAVRPNT